MMTPRDVFRCWPARRSPQRPRRRFSARARGLTLRLDSFDSRSVRLDHALHSRAAGERLRRSHGGLGLDEYSDEVRAVCQMVLTGEPAPISLDELAATTRATFRIRESLRTGQPVNV